MAYILSGHVEPNKLIISCARKGCKYCENGICSDPNRVSLDMDAHCEGFYARDN